MKRILFLLTVVFTAQQAIATEQCEPTPEKAVFSFYTWYLKSKSENKDPVIGKSETLNQYLSPELLVSIKTQTESKYGLDYDYFLKTQEYMDSWINDISVSNITSFNSISKETVTFAKNTEEEYSLEIILSKKDKCWFFSKVKNVIGNEEYQSFD